MKTHQIISYISPAPRLLQQSHGVAAKYRKRNSEFSRLFRSHNRTFPEVIPREYDEFLALLLCAAGAGQVLQLNINYQILQLHCQLALHYVIDSCTTITRSPAIAEGPRDAGVPVEIW